MKKKNYLLSILLLCLLLLCGCTTQTDQETVPENETPVSQDFVTVPEPTDSPTISLDQIPAYTSQPYITINGDVPFFTADDITSECYISLSDLDAEQRCGAAMMCAGPETLPDTERGEIGAIKPTGWMQEKYPGIIPENPSYLYNRAHLLMWALSGINADDRNLITGTRYLNIEGMLPNEESITDYIYNTGHHVIYRVTPIFEGSDLLAKGVLMEAQSVEDDNLIFCRYAYNVQPGIVIDYATGASHASEDALVTTEDVTDTYILNTNTKKIHRPDCSSVDDMKDKNKETYTGPIDALLEQGYTRCQRCNP